MISITVYLVPAGGKGHCFSGWDLVITGNQEGVIGFFQAATLNTPLVYRYADR